MKIAVRLDDMAPGMNWEKFFRMKRLLDEVHALPLFGIVPDCRDPKLQTDPPRDDFWTIMKQCQEDGWTPALHGWHHVYTTRRGGLFPLNAQSEFAGVPLRQQKIMLVEGKRILEDHGILTDFFMAPSHSYDENTLTALKECGFSKMTDGFGTHPYLYHGITFYPISIDRKKTLSDKSGNPTTLVFHCNTMSRQDFDRAEKILKEQDILPYREYLYYPAKKRSAAGHAREYVLALAKRTAVSLMSRQEERK